MNSALLCPSVFQFNGNIVPRYISVRMAKEPLACPMPTKVYKLLIQVSSLDIHHGRQMF